MKKSKKTKAPPKVNKADTGKNIHKLGGSGDRWPGKKVGGGKTP